MICLIFGACSSPDTASKTHAGGPSPSPSPTAKPVIACHVYYGLKSGRGGLEARELVLEENSTRKARFKRFEFVGSYDRDPYEGRTFLTRVRLGDGKQFASHLYQMHRKRLPDYEFVGSHGFTGLIYSLHPRYPVQLQHFCEIRAAT